MLNGNRFIAAAILAVTANGAAAQNLLDNPSFDQDLSLWDVGAFSSWSGVENHGASAAGDNSGSLEISTTSSDAASQCVAVMPGTTYLLQSWMEENPLREFDPCPAPSWNLEIAWFSDLMCTTGTLGATLKISSQPIPLGWYANTLVGYSPQAANSALVSLRSTCSTQNGTSTFYFDDVSFQPDGVFRNDFEVHAGKGGPGSG